MIGDAYQLCFTGFHLCYITARYLSCHHSYPCTTPHSLSSQASSESSFANRYQLTHHIATTRLQHPNILISPSLKPAKPASRRDTISLNGAPHETDSQPTVLIQIFSTQPESYEHIAIMSLTTITLRNGNILEPSDEILPGKLAVYELLDDTENRIFTGTFYLITDSPEHGDNYVVTHEGGNAWLRRAELDGSSEVIVGHLDRARLPQLPLPGTVDRYLVPEIIDAVPDDEQDGGKREERDINTAIHGPYDAHNLQSSPLSAGNLPASAAAGADDDVPVDISRSADPFLAASPSAEPDGLYATHEQHAPETPRPDNFVDDVPEYHLTTNKTPTRSREDVSASYADVGLDESICSGYSAPESEDDGDESDRWSVLSTGPVDRQWTVVYEEKDEVV
jgi:hypothetical protein